MAESRAKRAQRGTKVGNNAQYLLLITDIVGWLNS